MVDTRITGLGREVLQQPAAPPVNQAGIAREVVLQAPAPPMRLAALAREVLRTTAAINPVLSTALAREVLYSNVGSRVMSWRLGW